MLPWRGWPLCWRCSARLDYIVDELAGQLVDVACAGCSYVLRCRWVWYVGGISVVEWMYPAYLQVVAWGEVARLAAGGHLG